MGSVAVFLVQGTPWTYVNVYLLLFRGRAVAAGAPYCAAALSLVLHSTNPLLPTFRSDVRYFEAQVPTLIENMISVVVYMIV